MAHKDNTCYKYYGIYKTTCKINGKIYVGQHRTNDLNDSYLGSGKLLNEDIQKYGPENFIREWLFIYDNFDEMNNKEMEIVNTQFVKREDTYNMIIGGQIDDYQARKLGAEITNRKRKESGTLHMNIFSSKTIEEKNKIFQKRKETLRKRIDAGEIIPSFFGKHHTDEAKRKISRKLSIAQRGEKNSHFNHCWWKDPNDKTKEMLIKNGDPIPEGWIKGHWHNESLKKVHIKYCPYCGAEKGKCLYPEICNRSQMILGIKKIFPFSNFDFGTIKFYDWFFSILKQVKTWYIDEKLSILDIASKLSYKKTSLSSIYSCIKRLLNFQNIELRSFSEAAKNNKDKV